MKKTRIVLISSIFFIVALTLFFFLTEKVDGKPLIDSHTGIMYFWLVSYFILFIGGAYYLLSNKKSIEPKKSIQYLYVSLIAIFILKIIISSITKGFDIDTGCFTAWASSSSNNLFGFYTPAEWCDYPPLYISILSFCGKLTAIGIPKLIAIRLPALLAEIGISIIIYKIASKNFNRVVGLFLAIAFALNPLVIFDSSIWGQMDVVLAFFVVCGIYLVTKNNFVFSSIFFASAILIKPQALFFLPILIFALLKNKKILPILYSGLAGIATIFLIILPFDKIKFVYATSKSVAALNGIFQSISNLGLASFANGLKDLTAFLSGVPFFRDFLWLADLFLSTAGGYTYITVNAANTYFPFGKNWKSDTEKIFGLDFSTFGIILVSIVILFAAIIYFKGNHKSIPWFTAIFLNVGIFMTATRMHERYMFTVVALIIVAFIYSKDILTPILGVLFTLTIYVNTDYVFTRQLVVGNTWIADYSPTAILISILNLAGLAVLIAFLLGLAFNNFLPIFKPTPIKVLTKSSINQKKKIK